MTTRTFHFVEGNSSKFWTICLDGSAHTVQWGRIGTTGQTQTKEFASDDEAHRSYEKLVAEKVKKGYVEQGAEGAAPATASVGATPPDSRIAPAPVPKTKSTAKAAANAPISSPEPAEAAEPANPELPDAPPAVPTPVVTVAERALHLDPADWFWASWRDLTPLPTPEPAPFDQEDCANRIARMHTAHGGWEWHWDRVGIPPFLSREEAHFWLTAMTQPNRLKGTKELSEMLRSQQFDGDLDLEKIEGRLRKSQMTPTPELFAVLASLAPLPDLIQRFIDIQEWVRSQGTGHRAYEGLSQWLWHLVPGFRKYRLPYLTSAERKALGELAAPHMSPSLWPADHYTAVPFSMRIGALVGCHDAVRVLIESVKDDAYTGEDWGDYYQRPQEMVFGLGNPELVEHHMRRLRLKLKEPAYIRAWLAHTEYGALDYVRESIQAIGNKEEAEALVRTLALVQAPEAAPPMLELMLNSKAPRAAREWLEGNLAHSFAGLMPVAVGRGRIAEAALEFLRTQRRRGHGEALAAVAAAQPEEVASKVRALVIDFREKEYTPFDATTTPEWLHAGLAEVKKAKRPAWFQATDLPALTVGDHRLNDAQVEALLGALQASKLGTPHPLVQGVREHVDRSAADAFAWRLFELWLAEGGPSKENWAMVAVGLLGGDASALKLTPMIRVWPGESQHQRAVLGLECLRAIGTDAALMHINGIAQKLKFKGLKAKAKECMDAIAADRGLTTAQLEDRIVPDCDLDERGTRVFDFGPRRFRFVLGAGLKPMIKDEEGKVRPDLPKPNSKDDATLAGAAVEEWKLLKKVVTDATKIQIVRLEQAMVTGRRWSAAEFDLLMVRHPLMTNFAQLLVWGAYDADGNLTGTFRVTEDQSLADEQDEAFTLAPGSSVGLVHPLHLSDELRRTWGELLSDYELVPPFPQLGRGIFGLEPGEADQTEFERFNKGKIGKIPPTSLVGTLDRLGWVRGMPEDGGVFWEHSKPFYGANVTAILLYEDGIPIGYMEGWDDQELTGCFFVPGIYDPRIYANHTEKLPLGTIDPVVISEVLADLTTLASKAK